MTRAMHFAFFSDLWIIMSYYYFLFHGSFDFGNLYMIVFPCDAGWVGLCAGW